MSDKKHECPIVVMSGENLTVHSVVYLTESLLHTLDGNASMFTETRDNLNKYLKDRIKSESSCRRRMHKRKRIKILKSIKTFVDDTYNDFSA